ncbi:MAG: hypothetical protein JWM76_353 [Pseudonocardiales bacterium]|nr:hypothetical protein [Pseudonocardiales bacterium]
MDIHPDAMAPGLTREGVYSATQQALLTTHIGNGPTQIFMIGEDDTGRLLEISAVVRHEDILVVHTDEARPEYLSMLDGLPDRPRDEKGFGRGADGVVLTGELVQTLFDAADSGYDVDFLSTRTRPGRPAPITVGTVVRLGLDPILRRAVTDAASTAGVSEAAYIEGVLQDTIRS